MSIEHVEVRRGEYHDSVTLMLAGRAVAGVADVERVLVAMATELNVALLAELGYAALADAGPSDLIVAFTSTSPPSESAALEALTTALKPAPQPGGPITAPGHPHPDPTAAAPTPRTTATALGRTSAPITLISTPGLASVTEAMESLEYGASPIIFSDNIPIEHEVRLKDEARRRGLLVMGPDCGTVVLHGTGLAFANVTRPGPISLVAASGTGAQELMALLDTAGAGIRHCLGVGGRDLTEQVAGRSTLAALTALGEDPETELIAVVSKPPHPTIAAQIKAHAATLTKPVHFAFVGPTHPTLTESAERILTALGHDVPTPWPHWPPTTPPGEEHDNSGGAYGSGGDSDRNDNSGSDSDSGASHSGSGSDDGSGASRSADTPPHTTTIRGLFSGGTLRTEAEAVLLRAGARKIDKRTSGGRGEGESEELQNPAASPDHALATDPGAATADAAHSRAANTNNAPDTAAADPVRTHAASHDDALGTEANITRDNTDSHDGSPASVGTVAASSESVPSTHAYVNAAANDAERATAGAAEDPTAAPDPATAMAAPAGPAAASTAISTPVAFELTDFGDDAYTRGRPHPMIDNTLRLRALADAAGDPEVGVLLLDVVLGRGAHADPAGEVAAAVAGVRGARAGVAVVVSLCGTGLDPQGLGRQAEVLAGAGAWVFLSNAEAAGAALVLARGGVPGRGGE